MTLGTRVASPPPPSCRGRVVDDDDSGPGQGGADVPHHRADAVPLVVGGDHHPDHRRHRQIMARPIRATGTSSARGISRAIRERSRPQFDGQPALTLIGPVTM